MSRQLTRLIEHVQATHQISIDRKSITNYHLLDEWMRNSGFGGPVLLFQHPLKGCPLTRIRKITERLSSDKKKKITEVFGCLKIANKYRKILKSVELFF
jgi:hypothetical protein